MLAAMTAAPFRGFLVLLWSYFRDNWNRSFNRSDDLPISTHNKWMELKALTPVNALFLLIHWLPKETWLPLNWLSTTSFKRPFSRWVWVSQYPLSFPPSALEDTFGESGTGFHGLDALAVTQPTVSNADKNEYCHNVKTGDMHKETYSNCGAVLSHPSIDDYWQVEKRCHSHCYHTCYHRNYPQR